MNANRAFLAFLDKPLKNLTPNQGAAISTGCAGCGAAAQINLSPAISAAYAVSEVPVKTTGTMESATCAWADPSRHSAQICAQGISNMRADHQGAGYNPGT